MEEPTERGRRLASAREDVRCLEAIVRSRQCNDRQRIRYWDALAVVSADGRQVTQELADTCVEVMNYSIMADSVRFQFKLMAVCLVVVPVVFLVSFGALWIVKQLLLG